MDILEAAIVYYIVSKRAYTDSTERMVKVAFDTRRIDQERDFNPRRGAQYYHRSEGFIKKNVEASVETFLKLKTAVDHIKEKYIGSPQWLDSYCRTLSNSLDRILRAERNDEEFFEPQLNYLEELMDLRYRLKLADIDTLGEDRLKEVLLSKDEELKGSALYNIGVKKETQLQSNGVEDFLKDLLKGIKADATNNEVERAITITVRDKIIK